MKIVSIFKEAHPKERLGFVRKVSKEMKIFDNGETLKNVFVMNFEDNTDETKEKR